MNKTVSVVTIKMKIILQYNYKVKFLIKILQRIKQTISNEQIEVILYKDDIFKAAVLFLKDVNFL